MTESWAAAIGSAQPVDPSTGIPSASIPVLLVDDNTNKRLALRSILLPLGHQIVEANSGHAALRCVMVQNFAVILIDVRMPIMDGFETAAFIRQRRQSEMTPIIFITAHTPDELVSERYVQGAVDFICAPVKPDELRAKVAVFANLFARAEELAEQARDVQRSADQLRLLTESAPIGIFQTDADNRYVYTNPRWSEITGVSPEEATDQDWYTILNPAQRSIYAGEPAVSPANSAKLSGRFEISNQDCVKTVLMTSKSIPDTCGGHAGWVGTIADVTDEARAEAALSDARDRATEASQLKSDFLANMSHEIRTPMNGVVGMAQLLAETNLDSRQRDYVEAVRSSGEALMVIIGDLLDFSKVEAGKLQIERVPFDLLAVVQDSVDLLAGPAQAKGLELVACCHDSVPMIATGDPGRVRQVLINLIGNAIKFTQSGEIVARVSVAEESGQETVVRFEVTDTGDGIEAEKLGMIFEPFSQADTSTSRRHGGTGLGLAISRKLVGLMGGECGVSSQLGKGSSFWFTIRVAVDPETARVATPVADLAGVSILVVADSAAQRQVLSQYLAEWGVTVSTASSGSAGLAELRAAAQQGPPVAIALIDRSLPRTDWELLRAAIHNDETLDVQLVSLTRLGQVSDPGGDAAGGVYVSKPVHRTDLLEKLRTVLQLEVPDALPSKVTPKLPSQERIGQATRLLLLAEDNLVNQKVAVAMLSSGGYQVDTVPDGAAAVRAAATGCYEAILMDCQMPELDGYEATFAIRANEPEGRRIPIIAMTAGARPEDRERCLAAGMDGYISKPVAKDSLLALVSRTIQSSARGPVRAGGSFT